MVSVASLLLLFMKPSEVYHILQHLTQSSQEALLNPDQRDHIRWHLTLEKSQYFKLLSVFIKSYLKTTLRGKRSVLIHMNKIGFDFTKYVDVAFKSLLTSFVSLPIAIDILCMFLVEGVKILFRFTYAVMKCNKAFIKKVMNPAELIEALKAESREKSIPQNILKAAFKYPLKESHYILKKGDDGKIDASSKIGDSEFTDYVPNCPLNSSIVKFEELAQIWGFLPDYVKIRIPELVF